MNDAKALKSAINAGAPPGSAPNANGAEGKTLCHHNSCCI